ncbi:Ubiquitin carboxyl-terminal hydrolase 3 [Amphibalanus amphitrite]|uniref:Ubiquitin carboxyl-terminal hydrolase n=1 Tax=Amphibalanus amphitrite TaxID=1232801 RepID=A0A6A4X2C9_AMPAM|nr:Ubiquitin carboxyl-terminal hydrolase 3 [Amphibalanus amphitrite]
MECPHLEENVKIKKDIVTQHSKQWKCEVCRTTDSPWLCLHCGFVGCGRYVSGHAKRHHEEQSGHAVCIECHQLSVFCYQCDDFIFNDTAGGTIDKVRAVLSARHSTDNGPPTLRPPSTRKRKRSRLAASESEGEAENRVGKRPVRRRGRSADPQHTSQKPSCAAGLRNLGNTCFMNAVLQSLNNIQEFRSYMKELPDLADIIKERVQNGRSRVPGQVTRSTRDLNGELMTEELRKVLVELSTSSSAISPEALFSVIWKVVPRFRGYQQQDAHEFLRYMLDRLHTEMLTLLPTSSAPSQAARSSIVTSVFGGTLQNEVTCLICRTESKKHDPFLDLSLDIPDRFASQRKNKDGEQQTMCSLADCLDLFLDVEELADTELYYCNNCKQRQKSTKKFWIRRLPNVLCVHVKRFRWCNNYRTKLDVPLAFPVRALDMSSYLLGKVPETRRSAAGGQLYDLAAVIVHHGSGAGSGHYTAFASNAGAWYHFNDSTVRRAEEEQVAKCKAYILFYIRRELKLPQL